MRKLLLLTIAGTFLWASGGARGDEARAIIEKAVKAHGGADKLAKYKAVQTKGKGKLEILGGLEITQEASFLHPDKIKEVVEFEAGGQKIRTVSIFNGDKISIKANDMEVPLSDAIKAALKDVGYALKVARLEALLKDKAFELSPLGEVKVNDKPAVGVRVSSKGRKDISLFFGKEDGLLHKVESRAVDPMSGNEVNEERIILEYQKKDGMATPKKVLVNRDGAKFIELEVLEVKLLETLDENEFNP